ncbi:CU044_5270 family protein [Actinoallomurus rhizosphaericola]|uniref:CU044_5270 family protein n=1 Tax=Actinoallomurus rhizosphaericola TaxID=2952536 RepID=UPI0020906438|nr:CU044_5270 family protein [Actinoallomurus rhizosphaericola]MCO5992581.1 CU044_5270 family protein [Actinoallomurus rhizosphaericola]
MNVEYDEIARMLPEPGDPELSPLRHRQLKEHLMRETSARPRRRRRIRLVALLAPVAAGTAALALTLPSLLGSGSRQENVSYVPAPIIRVPAVSKAKVAPTLARIADAAARGPAADAGPHRYTYTKSMVESTRPTDQRTFGGPVEMIALHERQTWIPLDLSKETGLSRESGQETTLHSAIDALGYRQLAALPSDPAALLDRLYTRQGDRDPGRAFDQIQTLMSEVVVPPATRAALYRATALIPGVRVVSDSQDALGRKGIAVAFDKDGERTEWVFDKTSFAYLGDRDYLIADSDRGKAGTLMSASAVQTQTVVDGKGHRP